ncbi:efflux RND transporter permease subunit, partial [Klebsiella pneumoniae]|uniref:efflux RND transporter permease subunit n=1 Tax=Klebsiella pneumoniae TaxID=573 RepID=UPI00146B30F3
PPTPTLVVHLLSPVGEHDPLYMRNYATLKAKDELARLPGVGQTQIFGPGEYALRVSVSHTHLTLRAVP